MIFGNSNADFESEKERNLYYKIFAGYFFNELIPDYEERLQQFCRLLNNPTARGKSAPDLLITLDPKCTHVSFDNHLYLFEQLETDRGEFADILLHDSSTRTLIAIEAKMHSNWAYDKDVESNQRRHSQLKSILPQAVIVPVLLITRSRWDHAMDKQSNEHSNYVRFQQDPRCLFRVILWEDLAAIITEEKVRLFLESQLSRRERGFSYVSTGTWFVQQPPKTTNA